MEAIISRPTEYSVTWDRQDGTENNDLAYTWSLLWPDVIYMERNRLKYSCSFHAPLNTTQTVTRDKGRFIYVKRRNDLRFFFVHQTTPRSKSSTLYTQAYHSQIFLIFLYNTMAHKYYKWPSHNGFITDTTPENAPHLQDRKRLTDMAPPRLVFYGANTV